MFNSNLGSPYPSTRITLLSFLQVAHLKRSASTDDITHFGHDQDSPLLANENPSEFDLLEFLFLVHGPTGNGARSTNIESVPPDLDLELDLHVLQDALVRGNGLEDPNALHLLLQSLQHHQFTDLIMSSTMRTTLITSVTWNDRISLLPRCLSSRSSTALPALKSTNFYPKALTLFIGFDPSSLSRTTCQD